MNPWTAFIIGLLIGWVVEWIIDWVYWRRRRPGAPVVDDSECRAKVRSLEQEIESYKSQLASLQAAAAERVAAPTTQAQPQAAAGGLRSGGVDLSAVEEETAPRQDPLEELKGVSLELARLLHQAGVYTFAALGALKPSRLREIAVKGSLAPGGEVEIIKKARQAAGTMLQADDLVEIVGIGPVIASMLNEAGIFTFAELGALSQEDLREIVGERIQRLANEEQILTQARQFAKRHD